ncbi:MAG TPA: FKBP-type peptidyl-prolyl cis-trans isomerase [Candidatus Competibacteraceae bacterium]|nr:FKBP-type peptidyl-prolyl cis-trans isomerase [Candidatus Competibacteraceae bacterium]
MIRFPRALAAPAVLLAALAAGSATVSAKELSSDTEKLSYVLGMDVGNSIKKLNVELDRKVLLQAISDVLEGKKLQLTEEQASEIKQAYLKKKQEQAQAEARELAEKNLKKSEAFLAENKTKDGVKVTDSGLQYQVLVEGKGDKPKATDKVKVHYKGTLIDGTEFDSSYARNEPATFPLNGVIPGWTEGLQLMPVGSKYKFVIPPQLAYGDRGAGSAIGPNEALIFEVELLEIMKD